MTAHKDPAKQLAPIVNQLYDLASYGEVPAKLQQALMIEAHRLQGDVATLGAVKITEDAAAYPNFMRDLDTVRVALKQAQLDIEKTAMVVVEAGQLTKSIDALLKETVKVDSGPSDSSADLSSKRRIEP